MRIAIIGGHGKIGLLLTELLAINGHEAHGIIPHPDHAAAVMSRGGTPVVHDPDSMSVAELATALKDVDAVVYVDDRGQDISTPPMKTAARDGAIIAADAAERAGVRRLVVVSLAPAPSGDGTRAHADRPASPRPGAGPEASIQERTHTLDWTIVRPGTLTDEKPTYEIELAERIHTPGSVPRADVAATVVELLEHSGGVHCELDLVSGNTPLPQAIAECHRK